MSWLNRLALVRQGLFAGKAAQPAAPDTTSIEQAVLACGFDPNAYAGDNADLLAAGLGGESALRHYLKHGIYEQRLVTAGPFPKGLRSLFAAEAAPRALRTSLLNAQLHHPDTQTDNWNHPLAQRLAEAAELNARPYIIIGDSHSYAYVHVADIDKQTYLPLHFPCTGATAMGLGNPDSKSQYGQRLLEWMVRNAVPARQLPVFFKFGQVDTEFAWIFHRIRTRSLTTDMAAFEAFVARSVTQYVAYMLTVRDIVGDSLRICAIFPPALSDAAWAQGYVNAHIGFTETGMKAPELAAQVRELDIPDIRVRTAMHALYNRELAATCAANSLPFVDDFSPLVGADGTVKPEFLHGHDGSHHHLPQHLLTRVISELVTRHA